MIGETWHVPAQIPLLNAIEIKHIIPFGLIKEKAALSIEKVPSALFRRGDLRLHYFLVDVQRSTK